MKKLIILLLLTISSDFFKFAQAQTALTGSSVVTAGTILGWQGIPGAGGHTTTGVINRYYKVTAFNPAVGGTCAAPTTLANVTIGSGFGAAGPALAAGMEVLIIQMKAGTTLGVMDATLTSNSYGNVTNLGGAGNYEFATISTVVGSTVTFTKKLVNTYDPTGKVQLIPTNAEGTVAPNAKNYTASTPLRPMEYDEVNGVGGVFVLSTSGTLTLSAAGNINADSLGFQGGDTIGNPYANVNAIRIGCCVNYYAGGGGHSGQMDATNDVLYAFHLNLSESRTTTNCGSTTITIGKGGRKGRGIFGVLLNQELGWGKVANGGGGAFGFNSGGGGGGGYVNGGTGGNESGEDCNANFGPTGLDHGGRPGLGLQGGNTAIFMGGGGGAGHGDGVSTGGPFTAGTYLGGTYHGASSGGDGGGIIIIKASQITASGQKISAKGKTPIYSKSDGGGGGGGGGTVILEVPTYSGSLTIDVSGGAGAHSINQNLIAGDCHGTGGGGAGGRVVFSVGAIPGGVTLNTSGGAAGIVLVNDGSPSLKEKNIAYPGLMCGAGTNNGATAGITSAPTFSTPINTQTCVTLPVSLLNLSVALLSDNAVEVDWKTASESNSTKFIVEHSSDGQNFEDLASVLAQGNSNQVVSYSFKDEKVLSSSGYVYYRLRSVNLDDSFEYSNVVALKLKGTVVSVYPNPFRGEGGINVVYYTDIESNLTTGLEDILGRHLNSQVITLVKGTNQFKLNTEGLSKGMYLVYLNDKYGKTIEKIIIE